MPVNNKAQSASCCDFVQTNRNLVAGPIKGRFAPSPTGRIHAGNIFAALIAWLIAKAQNGTIVLRIEDLDPQRSKPEFINQVQRDFEALGLFWDEGPYFQHNRTEAYYDAFRTLKDRNLIYPCFCTRADLHTASAPHAGEKLIYAGTCRFLNNTERARRSALRNPAQRLITPDKNISFTDDIQGPYTQNLAHDCGDFLVQRSDGIFAYQLAVVVDDAEQGISSVVRGVDLLSSTPQQLYLQDLLGLPSVTYSHVPLMVAKEGRRLSKRDRDAELEALLDRFKSPQGVIGHIAALSGLIPHEEPTTPEELLKVFNLDAFIQHLPSKTEITWK